MIEYYSKQMVKASKITKLTNDEDNIFIDTESSKESYSFPHGIINDAIPNPSPGDYLVSLDNIFFIMDKTEFDKSYSRLN